MNGIALVNIYISVVDNLMKEQDVDNMYVMSGDNTRASFNAEDFRAEIHDMLADEDVVKQLGVGNKRSKEIEREIMRNFKTLGLIISDKERFTTTQRISGKLRRVMMIDYLKFELLKNLSWKGVSIWDS